MCKISTHSLKKYEFINILHKKYINIYFSFDNCTIMLKIKTSKIIWQSQYYIVNLPTN